MPSGPPTTKGWMNRRGSTSKGTGHVFTREQLARIVAQMPLCISAGKLGAAILWLQACSGADVLIGEIGGTSMLCRLLRQSICDHMLEGPYEELAVWACSALWRLSFVPANSKIILDDVAPLLLDAMTQAGHPTLSAAAAGRAAARCTDT